MLRFFGVICHKRFHCKCAFIEKAQHLQRWISLRSFTRGRLVPRQPRAIKNTTRTELRDETIVGVTWLIIKDKIVDAISSYKIRLNTRPFDADYRVKWRVLWYKMTQIILWNIRFNTMGIAFSFTIQPLNTLLYLCILLIIICKALCFSINLLWFESMF